MMKDWRDLCLEDLDHSIRLIRYEHLRQIRKWHIQKHHPFVWLSILMEEVGELAKAINECEFNDCRISKVQDEAVQVATLAIKILEMSQSEGYK